MAHFLRHVPHTIRGFQGVVGWCIERGALGLGRSCCTLVSAMLAGTLGVTFAGCGGENGPLEGTDWRAQIDTIGDTVVVRTLSGSEWGAAELVPEVRIGALEGADYEIFGNITGLAVDTAGNIYVFDAQAHALRKYDADGRFVATFGREGAGPGEYAQVYGLAVLSDGRVLLRDPGNLRFTVYASDGQFLETWPAREWGTSPITPTADGGFWGEASAPGAPTRLVHYGPDGTPGDSLPLPESRVAPSTVTARRESASYTWSVPFTPTSRWVLHPDGYFLAAAIDAYAIDLLHRNGHVLRIARSVERVPVLPAERAAAEQRVTAHMRSLVPSWDWNGPPIPHSKPILRDLYVALDGRIWVRLYQAGEPVPEEELESVPDGYPPPPRFREPVVFDVFEIDGRYLGRVSTPPRFGTEPNPVFRGDHVWSTERDELGVQFVVRYRITVEPRSSTVTG
jgi:hypothetical protein